MFTPQILPTTRLFTPINYIEPSSNNQELLKVPSFNCLTPIKPTRIESKNSATNLNTLW